MAATAKCLCADCAFEHFYGHLQCESCIEQLQFIWALRYDRLCRSAHNLKPYCLQALLQHIDALQNRIHRLYCHVKEASELDDQPSQEASWRADETLERSDGCDETSSLEVGGAEKASWGEKPVERAVCVICLDGTATLVGKFCGHQVWCRKCRRRAVHDQLHNQGTKRTLSSKALTRTRLPCPMCRLETCVVEAHKAKGQVFVPLAE